MDGNRLLRRHNKGNEHIPANSTRMADAFLTISTFAIFITPHEKIDEGHERTTNVIWTDQATHDFHFYIEFIRVKILKLDILK